MTTEQQSPPQLARRLSLPLLVLYGVGTILGAGIYVLAGKVAGESGLFAPHAFVLAAVIVGFSAHSYAKLSSRFPSSAGEAVYISETLAQQWLATAVGWAIVFTGVVSSATISRGFAAYIDPYLPLGDELTIALLITILCLLSIWGVSQAVGIAALFTLIEVGGIGLVVWLALPEIPRLAHEHPAVFSIPPLRELPAISFGAFLAFYAFIGFEDIVNMAEEVKSPERNLPRAVYLSLAITTIIYFATALAFMALLPLDVFIGSDAPFAEVARNDAHLSLPLITAISIAAITNGALIQIVMGSRVLYGLANRRMAPRALARVSVTTRTPIVATIAVSITVLLFALVLPLTTLARLTSSVVLIIFSLMNLSLFALELRERRAGSNRIGTLVKLAIPLIGLCLCIAFLLIQLLNTELSQ